MDKGGLCPQKGISEEAKGVSRSGSGPENRGQYLGLWVNRVFGKAWFRSI